MTDQLSAKCLHTSTQLVHLFRQGREMREGKISAMIHYDMHLGLSDMEDTVARTVSRLQPHLDEFDSITTEGISGMIVAIPTALVLQKPLVIVRKDTHALCIHASEVEGARHAGRRTLFIDDHVDLGRTLKHVRHQLSDHAPHCRIAGIYTYQDDELEFVR